jgi:hypothetical protein
MRKLMLTLSLIAIAGVAGAATADSGASKARYHTISGRTLVWHTPQAEPPYALKGVGAAPKAQAQQQRLEFRTHGRAGTSVQLPAAR